MVAGGQSQVRELSGGSGFGSQDGLVAAFGIGAATAIDSVFVRWPSGIVEVLSPVPLADQRLDVTETSAPLAVGGGSAPGSRLRLSPATPNPFRASTRIDYELPRSASVRLSVHDAQGRCVATLAAGTQAAGRHSVSWDGRDAAGRERHTGFYMVRLGMTGRAGPDMQVAKLMLTR